MKKTMAVIFSLFLILGIVTYAGAWQIELGDAYDVSGYWAYDITFNGEDTDNLSLIGLSLGYDTDDVNYTNVLYQSYNDGAFPVAHDTWAGGGFPATNDSQSGLVYSIMGEEVLGNPNSFFPVATGQTLLFTAYFEAVGGGNFDDTSVYFTYGSDVTPLAVEGVEVNGVYTENHALTITAETISTVPVPAAVWLLGSGLFGLTGLRRRKA